MYYCLHIPGCKNPAFKYAEVPRIGDPLSVNKAVLLDGRIPGKGEELICGTCGKPVSPKCLKPENMVVVE